MFFLQSNLTVTGENKTVLIDEYNPLRPNDYDDFKERARLKEDTERRERERERERERRDRERERSDERSKDRDKDDRSDRRLLWFKFPYFPMCRSDLYISQVLFSRVLKILRAPVLSCCY